MSHVPHLGARPGPLPPRPVQTAQPCASLSWNEVMPVHILGGRKERTNEEFALNAFFLKTINNQNSLRDHGNCFGK